MIYDVIVVGGGPAGITAAATIVRQSFRCALLTQSLGGQLNEASTINNWPAQEKISGQEISAKLSLQLSSPASNIDVNEKARVKEVRQVQYASELPTYSVVTDKGDVLRTRSLILAMGAHHNTLGLTNEEKLTGKGVSYCATCDAPYFKNKTVAVLGKGPEAKSVLHELSRVASRVYSLQPDKDKGLVSKNKKIEFLFGVRSIAVLGQERVTGLKYSDTKTGKTREIALDGVFIVTSITPNSELIKHLVKTDRIGQIVVDHQTMATSGIGIFAAGDVTDSRYKQVSTAIGDATKAALSAAKYLTAINETKELRW